MSGRNTWKLQDAKARFSEVVRRARAGEPQHVTVHGKDAVVVVDAERFEVRSKPEREPTMAEFVERSRNYRGATEGIIFQKRAVMDVRSRQTFSDEEGE